jgi:DNA transformation protein
MKKPPKPRHPSRLAPLRVSPGFRAFVLDQLDELGDVRAKGMFGGVGLYRGELFFGIIAGDVLYLKVDAASRHDYEAAGMQAFKPYADRAGKMQYYAVPLEVLESPIELAVWARKALAAAARSRTENRASPRRGSKPAGRA